MLLVKVKYLGLLLCFYHLLCIHIRRRKSISHHGRRCCWLRLFLLLRRNCLLRFYLQRLSMNWVTSLQQNFPVCRSMNLLCLWALPSSSGRKGRPSIPFAAFLSVVIAPWRERMATAIRTAAGYSHFFTVPPSPSADAAVLLRCRRRRAWGTAHPDWWVPPGGGAWR